MRTFVFLSNFLLIISSFNSHQQNNNQIIKLNGKTISLKPTSKKQVSRYSFKPSEKNFTPLTIKKVHGVIQLTLLNGHYITLKDKGTDTDDIDKKIYHFKGILLNRFYVVLVNYYETGEYLLIDKKNGGTVKLWSEPYISPDNLHIISFSGSLDYDMESNGIQLFEIGPDRIKLDWEYKINDWQPDAITWKDNNALLVLKVIPDYISPTKKAVKSYLELSF